MITWKPVECLSMKFKHSERNAAIINALQGGSHTKHEIVKILHDKGVVPLNWWGYFLVSLIIAMGVEDPENPEGIIYSFAQENGKFTLTK